ncbi:hypothetical protein AC578_1781 [Pseudocercospora eumusae]|uniref:Tat pathway signal sequence n=1 Tax=Pseudocercospora eumusae TaxID=321146 RepID=A0A139H7H7_9PEZI|nr:hypothetical protein AC578_1781 [Pseudocercospora eumusae]
MASFDMYDDEKHTEVDTSSDDSSTQAPLLWSPEVFERRSRWRSWRFWLPLGFSYILTAGLSAVVTKSLVNRPCASKDRVPPFLSSIDRSLHVEMGNAAGAVGLEGKETWNNFTMSTEFGGDEIEDWWYDLGVYTTAILVPEEFAEDFALDPAKHALVRPDDPDYAPGSVPYAGYPMAFEVTHKLHCLNLIRQATWFNHEYYRSIHHRTWSGEGHLTADGVPFETIMREHVGHCVDVLRQNLICDADIELVPYLKGRGNSNDWKRPKTCKNFAAVREFVANHQWTAALTTPFFLDDHHASFKGTAMTRKPKHSMEELWRGF